MALNIIVKQKAPHPVEVIKELERRQNERITAFNREKWRIAAKQLDDALRKIDGNPDAALVVPKALDGLFMDSCRRDEGHTDWRGSKSWLDRLGKQPEMSVLTCTPERRKKFERLKSEATK